MMRELQNVYGIASFAPLSTDLLFASHMGLELSHQAGQSQALSDEPPFLQHRQQ